MPSTMLPTPAPSTEIEGKRGSFSHGQIDAAFTLPPAAIAAAAAAAIELRSEPSPSSSSTTSNGSDSSYRPLSPQRSNQSATAKTTTTTTNATPARPSTGSRRRSSTANQKHDALISPGMVPGSVEGSLVQTAAQSYTLPPPPTRSRKIIQMKPRAQEASIGEAEEMLGNSSDRHGSTASAPSQATKKVTSATAVAALETNQAAAVSSTSGTKRKQQAGPTTAAGRKIARKTAHSLIERRRRSKMNEEFAVLKDMIPACEGQDMHKLQVLSASIEYMRYLEQCLADLKTVHARCAPHSSHDVTSSNNHSLAYSQPPASHMISPTTKHQFTPTQHRNEDSEMSDADTATSPHSSLPPSVGPRPMHAPGAPYASHAPSISPAIMPSAHVSPALNASQQRGSYSQLYGMMGGAPSAMGPSYNYAGSAYSSQHPSPAFLPQVSSGSGNPSGYGAFRLNSPAMSDGPGTGSRGEIASLSAAVGTSLEGKGRLETPDKEATAALMMLNTDRRSWTGSTQDGDAGPPSSARSARGMSVRDLLLN